MSGPQSWQEMRDGIHRRKNQVRRRNQQIKTLKKKNKALFEIAKEMRECISRFPDNPFAVLEMYDEKWDKVLKEAEGERS